MSCGPTNDHLDKPVVRVWTAITDSPEIFTGPKLDL